VAGPGTHEPIDGPLVLLAYKERDPGERQLWYMMVCETGVVLECVGKQSGARGLPVEIWLGREALTHLFTGLAKSQTALSDKLPPHILSLSWNPIIRYCLLVNWAVCKRLGR
jgi:hypothetical protein